MSRAVMHGDRRPEVRENDCEAWSFADLVAQKYSGCLLVRSMLL